MQRQGVDSKFANETEEDRALRLEIGGPVGGEVDEDGPRRGKKLSLNASRLRHCRKVVVHKVAEAMPGIVDALVIESSKGSFEHTKEILKLAHAAQEKVVVEPPKRRESGYARRLLEKMRRPLEPGEDPKARAASFR